MAKRSHDPLEVADSSFLTDADWAEINKIKKAYQTGGTKALSRAMDELAAGDSIRYLHVLGAFFPEMVRESIRDSMAELGVTTEDLREILEKRRRYRKAALPVGIRQSRGSARAVVRTLKGHAALLVAEPRADGWSSCQNLVKGHA